MVVDRGLTWRGTGFVNNNVYQGSNDDYRVESGERLAVNPANSTVKSCVRRVVKR